MALLIRDGKQLRQLVDNAVNRLHRVPGSGLKTA